MRTKMPKRILLFLFMSKTIFNFAEDTPETPPSFLSENQSYKDYHSNSNQSECFNTYLSKDEKWFLSQLSPIHQNIFCTHFTPDQRSQAMKIHQSGIKKSRQGSHSQTISPDMAVEIVLETTRVKNKQAPERYQSPPPSSKYRYKTHPYYDQPKESLSPQNQHPPPPYYPQKKKPQS